jgi:predicted CoA-binding protein
MMPSDQELLEIYQSTKTIAVVGASDDESKPAHRIPAYLQSQGYKVIPVNPRGGVILGEQAYQTLSQVDGPVDVVDVFRPPQEAESVARQAVEIRPRVLWFQPGTATPEAVQAGMAAGLIVITGHCLGETHGRLGLGPGPD